MPRRNQPNLTTEANGAAEPAVVANDRTDLKAILREAIDALEWDPDALRALLHKIVDHIG